MWACKLKLTFDHKEFLIKRMKNRKHYNQNLTPCYVIQKEQICQKKKIHIEIAVKTFLHGTFHHHMYLATECVEDLINIELTGR